MREIPVLPVKKNLIADIVSNRIFPFEHHGLPCGDIKRILVPRKIKPSRRKQRVLTGLVFRIARYYGKNRSNCNEYIQ